MSEASKAFDGDTVSVWDSRCEECSPGVAFLGVAFLEQRSVGSIRLLQHSPCTAISLQWGSSSGAFQTLQFWEGVTTSGVLTVPTEEHSLWRLSCGGIVGQAWSVRSFTFGDQRCDRHQELKGVSVASTGSVSSEGVWTSACRGCQPGEAYVGTWIDVPPQDLGVQCVLVDQPMLCDALSLERREFSQ
mmetsp:Transcript_141025/g.316208  ORF Transcript_141025/g.316208 Transcript_141025/m.316208 type:complete len:188 (-) Transcript_141025:6-569(-)